MIGQFICHSRQIFCQPRTRNGFQLDS